MAQDKWSTSTRFDLDGWQGANTLVIIKDKEDQQPTTLPAELLWYHHKFGHISFWKLVEMAKLGIIPKHLAKCWTLTCSACLYAKALRRPWCSSRSASYQANKAWQMHIRWSTSIAYTRPHCSDEQFLNNEALQICNPINMKRHFFRDFINWKEITTHNFAEGYLTKAVSYDILPQLCPMVMGW